MKNISLFVVFTLFAGIQLNDPDPLLWVVIYGVVAIAALLAQFAPGLPLRTPILVYQIVLSIYSLFYLPSLIDYFAQPNKIELVGQMKAESPLIEGTREMLGLVIAVVALHFIKKTDSNTEQERADSADDLGNL